MTSASMRSCPDWRTAPPRVHSAAEVVSSCLFFIRTTVIEIQIGFDIEMISSQEYQKLIHQAGHNDIAVLFCCCCVIDRHINTSALAVNVSNNITSSATLALYIY